MTDPTDPGAEPIVVNAHAAKDQLATGIRYALMAASSVATALGFAEAAGKFNALLVTAGPVATALVFAWGQISARRQSHTKRALAAQLPDHVAQVK